MECCDKCQLMTDTTEGLRALVSDEDYKHYTCDDAQRQSSFTGYPLYRLIRRIVPQCKISSKDSHARDGVIVFWP